MSSGTAEKELRSQPMVLRSLQHATEEQQNGRTVDRQQTLIHFIAMIVTFGALLADLKLRYCATVFFAAQLLQRRYNRSPAGGAQLAVSLLWRRCSLAIGLLWRPPLALRLGDCPASGGAHASSSSQIDSTLPCRVHSETVLAMLRFARPVFASVLLTESSCVRNSLVSVGVRILFTFCQAAFSRTANLGRSSVLEVWASDYIN